MPGRRVKIEFQGEEVEAEEVQINQMRETSSEYLLEDGSELRFRLVVTRVLRLIDRWDETGDPIYIIKSQNVLDVSPQQELRRSN